MCVTQMSSPPLAVTASDFAASQLVKNGQLGKKMDPGNSLSKQNID